MSEQELTNYLTGAVALGTLVMAGFTAWLAKQTASSVSQQERHHRDRMRPYCVMTFYQSDDLNTFGKQFHPATAGTVIHLSGRVENKGGGPARDVAVYLNTRRGAGDSDVYRLTSLVVVSGLIAAGESLSVDISISDSDIIPEWDGSTWVQTAGVHQVASDTYEVVLQYKSVLEEPREIFRTVHPKGVWVTGLRESKEQAMLRPARPMPIFLAGEQSVRTLKDCPQPPGYQGG